MIGPSADDYEDVAALHQIRDGGVFFVDAGATDVMLFRQGDTVRAFGANCTHAFASLRDGRVEGGTITCLRHGARFDLTSGRSLGGNCPNLPSYAVKREGARILVKA
ncbi:Rieske (2Fe-2S) protein [Terrarubrum flagellatum]|uniref:Rieske (2Fe-2S) protein n=1 Tax=Terrirubrum flagellatum TaxID=2895980 RepID=UPI00314504FF